jgi:hypothetical protein
MKIENIEINGDSIANAIRKYYPNYIKLVESQSLYNYVLIFGIRVDTCDTGLPDDFLGAIRLEKSLITGDDYWNFILTNGTTDPSPDYLVKTIDNAARLAGGTAWVKEGQYIYYKLNGGYKGYPAFAPKDTIKVYRWMPSKSGELFDPSKAKLSTSVDTLIHRSWASGRFTKDSAGCQVFKNNSLLKDLAEWADKHISIYKMNSFTYTLLTKKQFIEANTANTATSIFNPLYWINNWINK